MAIKILGLTLAGGEAQRKAEASNVYAKKYPLSNNVNEIQANINKANVELVELKNSTPTTAGGKRIKTRNITALSNWIIQLQNTIKDIQTGMGSATNANLFAKPSADVLVGKTAYSVLPKYGSQDIKLKKPTAADILKTPVYVPAPEEAAGPVEDTTKGAKGDYPPPQGVQGSNALKYIGYVAVAIGVFGLAYYFIKKKK